MAYCTVLDVARRIGVKLDNTTYYIITDNTIATLSELEDFDESDIVALTALKDIYRVEEDLNTALEAFSDDQIELVFQYVGKLMPISKEDIETLSNEITAKMNGILRGIGYATPITDAEDLLILVDPCASWVGYKVQGSRYSEVSDTESPIGIKMKIDYQNFIEKELPTIVLNSPKISATTGIPQFGYSSEEPNFTKNMSL